MNPMGYAISGITAITRDTDLDHGMQHLVSRILNAENDARIAVHHEQHVIRQGLVPLFSYFAECECVKILQKKQTEQKGHGAAYRGRGWCRG